MAHFGALGLLVLAACGAPQPNDLLNITFSPSVETGHYATWDFELESCREFDDPRSSDTFLRAHLLSSIEEELELRGYQRRMGEDVDFTVFYELWLADGGDLVGTGVEERARGRLLVRDVATGRLVWRGECKAPVTKSATRDEQAARVRQFVRDLLEHTRRLKDLLQRA